MRFSIRSIFAVTFLAALALFAFMNTARLRETQLHVALTEAEIQILRVLYGADKPAMQQILRSLSEQGKQLESVEQDALEHFDRVRDKYSLVTKRGDDVFSFRLLDSLLSDPKRASVTYRLIVPPNREVWLKFGVHTHTAASFRRQRSKNTIEFLSDTLFTVNGPLEYRLPVGQHDLKIGKKLNDCESLEVWIHLDDNHLLHTVYEDPDVNSANGSNTAPRGRQFDVGPNRQLPWLATFNVRLELASGQQTKPHSYTIWLSDHSSNYAEFPGDD